MVQNKKSKNNLTLPSQVKAHLNMIEVRLTLTQTGPTAGRCAAGPDDAPGGGWSTGLDVAGMTQLANTDTPKFSCPKEWDAGVVLHPFGGHPAVRYRG